MTLLGPMSRSSSDLNKQYIREFKKLDYFSLKLLLSNLKLPIVKIECKLYLFND